MGLEYNTEYIDCHYFESDTNDFIDCPVTKGWAYAKPDSVCIVCPYSRRWIKITKKEQEENYQWMVSSLFNAKKLGIVQCRGCWKWFDLHVLYRCFHCGSYFCTHCSYQHFGRHARTVTIKEKEKYDERTDNL